MNISTDDGFIVRPFIERDPEVMTQLRQENTRRLRIMMIFPVIISLSGFILRYFAVHILPTEASLSVLLAVNGPFFILYGLLWVKKTQHRAWLHVILMGVWIISVLLNPFGSTGDTVLLEFFVNLLLINLFILLPPVISILLNAAAFVVMLLNFSTMVSLIYEAGSVPAMDIPVILLSAMIFIGLAVMGIHQSLDEAMRIRRERLMRKQRDELVRMNKMRDDVDRIIRHDMKNPLNGILGVAQLLNMEDELPESIRDLPPILEQSGNTMLSLIDNSLDLFKMDEGTYRVKAAPFDMLALVKGLPGEFEGLCRQKDVEIVFNLHGLESLELNAEREKVHSMLSNLLVNAVEASPEHERVTLSLKSGHDAVEIDIHNYGAVPESIRDRFFERYATAGKSRGTGLGTYSAALIARAHGGSIDFTTSEEEGTHLHVRLPDM